MVLPRRVLSFGVFLVLVAAAAAFVAANWGRVNEGAAGAAALVAARSAGTAGSGTAALTSDVSDVGAGPVATAGAADYFASAHLRRAQAESREIDQLKQLAADASTSATVRAEAQEQILQREQLQEQESAAELVLQAKGFPQSLVMLRPGGATVVVQATSFGAGDAARVAQAVASTAGIDPAQVQIVPRGVSGTATSTAPAVG